MLNKFWLLLVNKGKPGIVTRFDYFQNLTQQCLLCKLKSKKTWNLFLNDISHKNPKYLLSHSPLQNLQTKNPLNITIELKSLAAVRS